MYFNLHLPFKKVSDETICKIKLGCEVNFISIKNYILCTLELKNIKSYPKMRDFRPGRDKIELLDTKLKLTR